MIEIVGANNSTQMVRSAAEIVADAVVDCGNPAEATPGGKIGVGPRARNLRARFWPKILRAWKFWGRGKSRPRGSRAVWPGEHIARGEIETVLVPDRLRAGVDLPRHVAAFDEARGRRAWRWLVRQCVDDDPEMRAW